MSDRTEKPLPAPEPVFHHDPPGPSAGPPAVTAAVISDDLIWAKLLALNLSARGMTVGERPADEVFLALKELPKGSWLIFDTGGSDAGDGSDTARPSVPELAESGISVAIVADYPAHFTARHSVRHDAVVERSPDMRVMARRLMEALTATPVDRAIDSLQPGWQ